MKILRIRVDSFYSRQQKKILPIPGTFTIFNCDNVALSNTCPRKTTAFLSGAISSERAIRSTAVYIRGSFFRAFRWVYNGASTVGVDG